MFRYDKKKEAKARQRQLYHLRHARDYEILGVPLGASKEECKKAYRSIFYLTDKYILSLVHFFIIIYFFIIYYYYL